MRDAAQTKALQLLFVALRGTMARSAIMAALVLNGSAAVIVLDLLGNLATTESARLVAVDPVLLKLALMVFSLSVSLAASTFVNAYMAQGAFAPDATSKLADRLRRFGLALIVLSLLLFLGGLWIAASAF
jgi:hypothetical protein